MLNLAQYKMAYSLYYFEHSSIWLLTNFLTNWAPFISGLHDKCMLAFFGRPLISIGSDGLIKFLLIIVCCCQSKSTVSNAAFKKSLRLWVFPVAIIKSSGKSIVSIRHIASTYSGAQPQSRRISIFPSSSFSSLPFAIRQTALTIFLVTKRSGRKGDSWLNKIPVAAKSP